MKTKAEKLEVMAAWLDGKEIEHRAKDSELPWTPVGGYVLSHWDKYDYRIKPQPAAGVKRVPLAMDDIPLMCWIRRKNDVVMQYLVDYIDFHGIGYFKAFIPYDQLMEHYDYSTDRVNWKPCYKEVVG